MADLKQYGILIMGLLIGGGFAFGGIASYAGLTSSGDQNAQQDRFNASTPSENYVESSFSLSSREQRVLAYRDNLVFVNVFYNSTDQKQAAENLKQLPEEFDNRVYVSVSDVSDASSVYYTYSSPTSELPLVVVIGGNQGYRVKSLENPELEEVSSEICSALRSIDPVSTQCIG